MYERNPLLVTGKFKEYLPPALLMSAAVSLGNVLDSMIVGKLLGSAALSAMSLALPIVYGINLLCILFRVGGSAAAAIAKGRRDARSADQLFTVTMVVGVASAVLYTVLILAASEGLSATLARGNAEVQAQVAAYLRTVVLSGPLLVFSFDLAQFSRADGNPRAAASVALVSNAVRLASDYALIRFAGMGIAAAGLATTLGFAAGTLTLMPYLLSGRRTFRLVWPGREVWARLGQIASLGLPSGLGQLTSLLRALALNAILMAALGAPGMAAMSVCLNALMIAQVFTSGASDAMLPIAGTLYGEGDAVGIRGSARAAGRIMLLAIALVTLFFLGWPQVVGGWFGITSARDLDVMVPALRMFALSLPLFAANNLLQSLYATTGREKLASAMALLDGFVFVVPFALALSKLDRRLFFLCYLCSGIATAGAALWMGRRIRRRENVRGLLLLGGDDPGALWEVTIPAQVEAATGVSERIIAFGTEQGLSPILANRVGVAVEEMAVNTAVHGAGQGRGASLDIRVRLAPAQLVVTLRDDGIPFDPTHYPGQDPRFATGGIELARRVATKLEYTHQLGFNTTVLAFHRTSNAEGP